MHNLENRTIAVFGVANEQSIAWHIAQALMHAGAKVYLGYQMRFRSRVMQLLKDAGAAGQPAGMGRCDLTVPAEVDTFFSETTGGRPIDGIVHSVAFAPPEALGKPVSEVAAGDFSRTAQASIWTLVQVARSASAYLSPNSSIVTMTYLGSSRVIPGYRIMGIAKAGLEAAVRELAVELGPRGVRVNAISAGPVRTLAALAVPDFEKMLDELAAVAPLRCNIEPRDVAELARFLLGEGARRITGQVMFVDSGFSVLGVTQ